MSVHHMLDKLTNIREVAVFYPTAPGAKKPGVRTVLSELDDEQKRFVDVLGLQRYQAH